MVIGYKIKKLRELRNFTQEYMAEKLKISQQGYGKLERGEIDVPFKRLNQIAIILCVKVEEVINFDEKPFFTSYQPEIKSAIVDQPMSSHEKKLYEEQISQLKDEVSYLRKLIDRIYLERELTETHGRIS